MNQQVSNIAQEKPTTEVHLEEKETTESTIKNKLKFSPLFLLISIGLSIATLLVLIFWVSNSRQQYKAISSYHSLGQSAKTLLHEGSANLKLLLLNNENTDFENDVITKFRNIQRVLEVASEDNYFKRRALEMDSIVFFMKKADSQLDSLVLNSDEYYANFIKQAKNKKKKVDKRYSETQQLEMLAKNLNDRQRFLSAAVDSTLTQIQTRINKKYDNIALVDIEDILVIFFILFILLGFSIWIYVLRKENESIREVSELQIQEQSQNIETQTQFVEEISKGKLYTKSLENQNNDRLAQSLLNMQKKLQQVSKDEHIRNWISKGLNTFADIIRSQSDSFQGLGDAVVTKAVEYLEACQGALYIVNEEKSNIYLDLLSCYAYQHKKFISRRIKINPAYAEGLVGQTYLEAEHIYLNQVPADYVLIQSGLGETKPQSLLLVPLKINETIEGILELASFNSLEPYQIEFIERVGQNIASAIASVKASERTKKLLRETQEQAQALRTQEEEMRQNMEELQTTQEELASKNSLVEQQKVSIEIALKEQKGKNKKLQEQEEELRQRMEELQSTQEALNQKSQAIIKMKEEETKNMQERAKKIESQNQLIESSINYAKSIQDAILPNTEIIQHFFAEFFVFFRAKDIVSGDFYWFYQYSENQAFIAAVDCTGHGVPGAFMSIIGNTLLNEIVSKQTEPNPAKVLEELHKGVRKRLKQKDSNNNDGMDVCLLLVTKRSNDDFEVKFAGAKRPLLYVQNQELKEMKGERKSIGGWQQEVKRTFSNEEKLLKKGDILYLTSDGYVDSPNSTRKKFGMKRLKKVIELNQHLPLGKQELVFESSLKTFQETAEQRDDITIVGVRL